jgi:hypothetical protein
MNPIFTLFYKMVRPKDLRRSLQIFSDSPLEKVKGA